MKPIDVWLIFLIIATVILFLAMLAYFVCLWRQQRHQRRTHSEALCYRQAQKPYEDLWASVISPEESKE